MKASDAVIAVLWGAGGAAGVSLGDGGFTKAAFMWGVGVMFGALLMAWRCRKD